MNPQVLAFYLPQYHPVKENNEWFGEGFTEWTNVGKAKPQFKGHAQPRVPADLGYYDLRVPEVRKKQAELAKEAGIAAFCYYHYWFGNGKQILEKPLKEIISFQEPDFPFCICWANHSWYKKQWNPSVNQLDQTLLLDQTYPGEEDIVQHFNELLPAFKDSRYYKIDGRLVFVIYDAMDIPNFSELKDIWNKMAIEHGLPEFYFISYTEKAELVNKEPYILYDSTILALGHAIESKGSSVKVSFPQLVKNFLRYRISRLTNKPMLVFEYSEAMKYLLDKVCMEERVIPTLYPNWDFTPRRGNGGLILKNALPSLFKKHAKEAFDLIKDKPVEKQIVFLKSWNEWGEGNYMEPDLLYGKGYIYALKEALSECD